MASAIPVVAVLAVLMSVSAPRSKLVSATSTTEGAVAAISAVSEPPASASPAVAMEPDGPVTEPKAYSDPEDQKDYQVIYDYIRSVYPKVTEEDAQDISRYLVDYGRAHNTDPKLAAALIARESAFNKKAVSSTGAKGLGQIKDFNFKSLKMEDPFDIRQNVYGTVRYLSWMIDKWKDDSDNMQLGIASYFRGYTNVKRTREDGQDDPKASQYVDDILQSYEDLKAKRDQI